MQIHVTLYQQHQAHIRFLLEHLQTGHLWTTVRFSLLMYRPLGVPCQSLAIALKHVSYKTDLQFSSTDLDLTNKQQGEVRGNHKDNTCMAHDNGHPKDMYCPIRIYIYDLDVCRY